MISPASSSNSTASITTLRSTPTTRAHTLFDCTPLLLARLPAVDSRKAKPDNGVHPWMLSYSPTEGDEEPEINEHAARGSRRRRVAVDESVVDPLGGGGEADPTRLVVADVGAAGNRRAVRVAVVAIRRVADVSLDDQVAQRHLGLVPVGEDVTHLWERLTRELVHERVRPCVAGGVREEAVGEREDLATLRRVVGRVGLGRPGRLEDVVEPLAALLRVDELLAHDDVGEPVGTDDSGVVVRLPGAQRVDDRRVDHV